jgi:hypothetical protein
MSSFVEIPGRRYELGWRFTVPVISELDHGVAELVEATIARCSARRSVTLEPFDIAVEPIPFVELIGDPYDLGVDTLEAMCELVDERLVASGLRLATEDELEAAAGGSLFPWGLQMPDGNPYQTTFGGHRGTNELGLRLLGDPYKAELCRHALKFGDGGEALHGGAPWPVPWLSLSPAFRQLSEEIRDFFPESFEDALVRPVRLR